MELVLGLSATQWTAIGSAAGVLSLVTALAIALIVQTAARRADAAAHQLRQAVAELARRGRRDDLVRALRTETDRDQLRLLLQEARVLAGEDEAERLAVEKAYRTNPSTPLLAHEHDVPALFGETSRRALVDAVVNSLAARYDDVPDAPPRLTDDLAGLTRLALDTRASSHRIARYLVDRAGADWHLGDLAFGAVLRPQAHGRRSNLDAASDYLDALQRPSVPSSTLLDALAGVSWALEASESTGGPVAGDPYTALILLMQRRLGGIGAQPDAQGRSISADHAVALMVSALGRLARGDAHLNLRALEALVPVLESFPPASFAGPVADHLATGVSALLATNAPAALRERLRAGARRLVPDLDGRIAEPAPGRGAR